MRPGPDGREVSYSVEYKQGALKVEDWDRAQLCAQAICLEDMRGVDVPAGAIFYGKPRRRERVDFSEDLRAMVERACRELHVIVERGETPFANHGKRCRGCFLVGECTPKTSRRVEYYLLAGLE